MALECNWPVGTLTSHPGFDKMLHSVLGDEGQSLNKQTVSMVGFKGRFVFIITKSGNDIVFLSLLFAPARWSALTCIRFMASRIWSRWWAELRASSRISVNFNSFSLSSLFSCRIISASASVHSQILKKETNTKSVARRETRGSGKAMLPLRLNCDIIQQLQRFCAASKT